MAADTAAYADVEAENAVLKRREKAEGKEEREEKRKVGCQGKEIVGMTPNHTNGNPNSV